MESGNSGIRFTAGLISTLITLTILLALFALFLSNSKQMKNKESELRQKENDSISMNVDSLNSGINDYEKVFDDLGVLV